MTNLDVINKFLHREAAQTPLRNITSNYHTYKGCTLYINIMDDGEIDLVNYSTIIARIQDHTLYLNDNKYSTTTSKIQTQLKQEALKYNYNISVLHDYNI